MKGSSETKLTLIGPLWEEGKKQDDEEDCYDTHDYQYGNHEDEIEYSYSKSSENASIKEMHD